MPGSSALSERDIPKFREPGYLRLLPKNAANLRTRNWPSEVVRETDLYCAIRFNAMRERDLRKE